MFDPERDGKPGQGGTTKRRPRRNTFFRKRGENVPMWGKRHRARSRLPPPPTMLARFIHSLPLDRKLVALCMLATGVALVLSTAAFVAFEQMAHRRDMRRATDALLHVISEHAAHALADGDPAAATRSLQGLASLPPVRRACIYDAEGRVVAIFERESSATERWPTMGDLSPAGADERPGLFREFSPLTAGTGGPPPGAGVAEGGVYMELDREELAARQADYFLALAPVLLVAFGLSWLLARRLQHVVSGPIENLARLAADVAAGREVSTRAVKAGNDAIGRLIEGFNHMLDQLQLRDARLHEAQRDLERRVEERTRSLEEAHAEIALERTRFKFIFDYVPVGICLQTLHDRQKQFRLINRAHLRICGVEADKAFADTAIFANITHPDDRARQVPLNQALESGAIKHYALEKRYLRADGSTVWVAFSTARTDYPDGRVEVLSTLVDITELKRAQLEAARERARFQFIFNSLPVGVSWRHVGERESALFNPAHHLITGVDPDSVADTRIAFHQATHPDDLPRQLALVDRMLAGDIDQYEVEKRYIHPDGRVVWAMMMSRMSRDPDTGERQSVTTIVDITARKQAEAEIEGIHRRLVETSRQAGMAEVATGVLHNVGNVLNSVNISCGLIADHLRRSKTANLPKLAGMLRDHRDELPRYLTEDAKGRLIPDYLTGLADSVSVERSALFAELESLQKNVDHIKSIVAMQQSFARITGVLEKVEIVELVEDALRMNAASLVRHEIEVVRDYVARPAITADKNKILQILVNCVANAKHACDDSDRRDKRITVRVAADGDGVRISVIDNGVGIAPDHLTRIFAHGFTTRKNGHGFGLHSGALAAHEMGGSLLAHSEGPGTGATFTLRLPAHPPE